MKRILVILVVLATLAWLGGCSDEETLPAGIGYPPLAGTWKLVQKTVLSDSGSTIKSIEMPELQTITFEADGRMSSTGDETSFYRSSRYYRVDSTRTGLRIGFIAGDLYTPFFQDFLLRSDSLVLIPCPSRACDLVFVKRR